MAFWTLRRPVVQARPIIVRVTRGMYDAIRSHLLRDHNEDFCYLFANVVQRDDVVIYIVQKWIKFPREAYVERGRARVSIRHEAKNALYNEFVESECNGIINCHSHPFTEEGVAFSPIDDRDDEREFKWIYEQLPIGKRHSGKPPAIHSLSMVFGHKSIDARGWDREGKTFIPVSHVQCVGEPYESIPMTSSRGGESVPDREVLDRQIRAFGSAGQKVLHSVRIGVVGAGGIGSIVAENLVRLGGRHVTIVDQDRLDVSNLNRWQGASRADVGRYKVDVLSDRLTAIDEDVVVKAVARPVFDADAIGALTACDWIVGGVDNHMTRYVLNRISGQYLMPYIDGATQIETIDGRISPRYRVGVFIPGHTACMECSQIKYFNAADVARHLYDATTIANMRIGGYIKDLPEEPSPSVMPLNAMVSGAMALEALNLATGFAPQARYIRVDYLAMNDKPLRLDSQTFAETCAPDCLTCNGYAACGDSEPLPIPVVEASANTGQ